MTTQELYIKYIERGQFNNPDYERDDELLSLFKIKHSTLSNEQEDQLIYYLMKDDQDWMSMYFVADLLYFYSDFGLDLMENMLQTGVNYSDPSFNRIFLRPCIRSKKRNATMNWLINKFKHGTLIERIGISKLYYWLGFEEVDISQLKIEIYNKAKTSNNIIELYFYKLAIGSLGFRFKPIPKDTDSLIKKVKGNTEYEKFLTEDLKWKM